MKKPKILAPAGDWSSLQAAINAGADEVYLGVTAFKGSNMRNKAKNFVVGDLKEITELCHKDNVKVNLAVNSIVYENELNKLDFVLDEAKKNDVDGIICWDMAVVQKALEKKLEVHLSTQASASNFDALKFYHKLGIRRIVLARELNLEQIKSIAKKIKEENLDVEVEAFIHGAMCLAVSGRCFMSLFHFGKDASANRGECLQPCRREYLVKDKDSGIEFELANGFVLSPKDLATIEIIDKIIEAEIDVLKIEGRMKGPEYVDTCVRAYKEGIDAYFEGRLTKELKEKLIKELVNVYNRGFHTGFYEHIPGGSTYTDARGSKSDEVKQFLGLVKNFYSKVNVAEILLQANDLKIGDEIYITGKTTGVVREKINEMQISHELVDFASRGSRVGVRLNSKVRENDEVYLIKRREEAEIPVEVDYG